MKHLPSNRGFTLIQLVIVLVVLGIIAAIVSANWPGTSPTVSSEADRIASDLRYLQNLATTQHTIYRMNFSSSQYTFTQLDGTTAVNHPATGSNTIALPSTMTLTTTNLPNNYVVFNSKGTPETDTSGTALATNATVAVTNGSVTSTITITPDTGTIQTPT